MNIIKESGYSGHFFQKKFTNCFTIARYEFKMMDQFCTIFLKGNTCDKQRFVFIVYGT